MPMPAIVFDPPRWPWVCSHAIREDQDQCDCGLRQAWPRQLEFNIEGETSGASRHGRRRQGPE